MLIFSHLCSEYSSWQYHLAANHIGYLSQMSVIECDFVYPFNCRLSHSRPTFLVVTRMISSKDFVCYSTQVAKRTGLRCSNASRLLCLLWLSNGALCDDPYPRLRGRKGADNGLDQNYLEERKLTKQRQPLEQLRQDRQEMVGSTKNTNMPCKISQSIYISYVLQYLFPGTRTISGNDEVRHLMEGHDGMFHPLSCNANVTVDTCLGPYAVPFSTIVAASDHTPLDAIVQGTATQSSTCWNNPASNAINSNHYDISETCEGRDTPAWWMVDLADNNTAVGEGMFVT